MELEEAEHAVTLVVNLVAGPGAGKSTTAAGTFFELKQRGVNCEYVPEFAKDLVWEDRTNVLGNQVYILGKQYHRLWRLQGKVDVIVTDCPLFLAVHYGDHMSEAFKSLALELFNGMDNMTFYLERAKAYNPAGRVQTEDKAKQIDQELWSLLNTHDVDFDWVRADGAAPEAIAEQVVSALRERGIK